MTIEQQVSNLELSKKLCELGVKQESLFYWGRNRNKSHYKKGEWDDWGCWYVKIGKDFTGDKIEFYSAFTVAELGEMLPNYVENNKLLIRKQQSEWRISYFFIESEVYCSLKGEDTYVEVDKNLSDAMAKMLIYLLENKLITL